MKEPEHNSDFFAEHANGRQAASYKPIPAHKNHLKTVTEIMLTVGVNWIQPGKQMHDNKILCLIN